MFVKKHKVINGESVISVTELKYFSLADTLECGQAFRYELLKKDAKDFRILKPSGEENLNSFINSLVVNFHEYCILDQNYV